MILHSGSVIVGDLVKAHECSDGLCEAVTLHRAYLFDVLLARKEGLQLSLLNDEVDGFNAHGVKKADTGVIVIHVGDVGLEPLHAVLGPDAREVPFASVALLFVCEASYLHAPEPDFGRPCGFARK